MREPQEGQQENRTIEGRPIVFGYEVLEPGCISRELLQKSDVVLNLNHSNMVPDVLGRYRNTDRDTLSLELRGDGIDCRCDLPNTSNANDTLELIKRGDINGMSFAFEDDYEDTENGVSYERTNDVEDGKEVWLRHVKKITGLYDVSIVTHPAYEQTTGMREASDAIDKAIEEQLKRECGDKNDKREDDPDDKGETDEEREAREKAEREANGGETNAEKESREAQEREANGGETNAEKAAREIREKAEQEARELEEQEQRFREQQAMRLRHRAQRLRTEQELESLIF